MKLTLTLAMAAIFAVALAWQGTAQAQGGQAAAPQISSEGAPTSDLPMSEYQAFDQFQQDHPEIIRDLSHNPHLINSRAFQSRHPEWRDFIDNHERLHTAMVEDPGNFFVPTGRAPMHHHHRHHRAMATTGAGNEAAAPANANPNGGTAAAPPAAPSAGGGTETAPPATGTGENAAPSGAGAPAGSAAAPSGTNPAGGAPATNP